jgi:UDP:flavonoid glycosyltransferase YjiC (YdhE family)
MPMLALAQGLRQAGYQPTVVTHEAFTGLVESYGVKVAPLAGDYRVFFRSQEGQRFLRGEFLPWEPVPQFAKNLPRQLEQVLAAAQGSQAIIAGPLALWSYHVAEALNLPLIVAASLPIVETGLFPFLGFGDIPTSVNPVQSALNWASYRLVGVLGWVRDRPILETFRERHQLPALPPLGPRYRAHHPKQLQQVPILHLYSEAVIPRPADWAQSSHPVHVTGYCFPRASQPYTPSPDLQNFLAQPQGEGSTPTIALGFGSMAVADEQAMLQLLLEAVDRANVSAVLLAGWGLTQTGQLTDLVYATPSMPHDWLFPQVSAVVHHSGSGTVAAGLRAGLPAVTVPFFGDQPAWANRLTQLGVAPPPIPIQNLTAHNLAAAIKQVLSSPTMAAKAIALGETIRAEDGVNCAVSIIQAFVDSVGW